MPIALFNELEMEAEMEKLRDLTLKNLLFCFVAFVGSYAGNLWFEKHKAIEMLKLEDSTTISTKVSELWDSIMLLEVEYSDLDRLQAERDFWLRSERRVDGPLNTNIQETTRTVEAEHNEMQDALWANSHVIGEPMLRHMALYLSLLKSYYQNKEHARTAHREEPRGEQTFMDQHNAEIAGTLYRMRVDTASIRRYALKQVTY